MAAQAKAHQNKIIESMLRPNFYPEPVRSVTLRETHISTVFLTGDVVYKVKKAVDMDFLDFTVLENRLPKIGVAIVKELIKFLDNLFSDEEIRALDLIHR